MHPDDEVLAAIALGEDVPDEAAAHAAACPQCAAMVADLAEVLVLARATGGGGLVDPPASVWAGIAARLEQEEVPALPAPEPTPADEAPADELARRRGRGGPRARWLVAAAAAGVALGVLGTQVVSLVGAPAQAVVARAPLDTLDTAERRGEANLVREQGGYALRVGVQPLQAGPDVLEVWLINTDGVRMVSVGILPDSATTGVFPVADQLFDQGYRIVDISREPLDDRPEHSGDSLVRGTLA